MCDGRQRAEWQRTAALAVRVHASMTGEALDPNEMIPDRYRVAVPEREKTPEDEARENRCAWGLLDAAFNPGGK